MFEIDSLKLGTCIDYYIEWNNAIYEKGDFDKFREEYVSWSKGHERFIDVALEEFERVGNRFAKISDLNFFNETTDKKFDISFDADFKNSTISMIVQENDTLEQLHLIVVKAIADDGLAIHYN